MSKTLKTSVFGKSVKSRDLYWQNFVQQVKSICISNARPDLMSIGLQKVNVECCSWQIKCIVLRTVTSPKTIWLQFQHESPFNWQSVWCSFHSHDLSSDVLKKEIPFAYSAYCACSIWFWRSLDYPSATVNYLVSPFK